MCWPLLDRAKSKVLALAVSTGRARFSSSALMIVSRMLRSWGTGRQPLGQHSLHPRQFLLRRLRNGDVLDDQLAVSLFNFKIVQPIRRTVNNRLPAVYPTHLYRSRSY